MSDEIRARVQRAVDQQNELNALRLEALEDERAELLRDVLPGVQRPQVELPAKTSRFTFTEQTGAGGSSGKDSIRNRALKEHMGGWKLDDRTGLKPGRPPHKPSDLALAIVRERLDAECDRLRRKRLEQIPERLRHMVRSDEKMIRRKAVATSPANTATLSIVAGVSQSTIRAWRRTYRDADVALAAKADRELRTAAKSAQGAYAGGLKELREDIHPSPRAPINERSSTWRHRTAGGDHLTHRPELPTPRMEEEALTQQQLDRIEAMVSRIDERLAPTNPTRAELATAVDSLIASAIEPAPSFQEIYESAVQEKSFKVRPPVLADS